MKGKKDTKGLTVKKSENFSEWYSEVVQKAELADLRYNVKGFLVFQPWSVLSMEKMYEYLESVLVRKTSNLELVWVTCISNVLEGLSEGSIIFISRFLFI